MKSQLIAAAKVLLNLPAKKPTKEQRLFMHEIEFYKEQSASHDAATESLRAAIDAAETPLTGEQLRDIARGYKANDQHRMRDHWDLFVSFARSVEAAHGITGEMK